MMGVQIELNNAFEKNNYTSNEIKNKKYNAKKKTKQ